MLWQTATIHGSTAMTTKSMLLAEDQARPQYRHHRPRSQQENDVVIQGTVMDISAGTTQTEQAADFPHGVPCASDDRMTAWMGYVYQQQPCPTNFTGVTVTLTVIDPNHNFITLGTATTDGSGLYYLDWSPPVSRATTSSPLHSLAPTVIGDQAHKPTWLYKTHLL